MKEPSSRAIAAAIDAYRNTLAHQRHNKHGFAMPAALRAAYTIDFDTNNTQQEKGN